MPDELPKRSRTGLSWLSAGCGFLVALFISMWVPTQEEDRLAGFLGLWLLAYVASYAVFGLVRAGAFDSKEKGS